MRDEAQEDAYENWVEQCTDELNHVQRLRGSSCGIKVTVEDFKDPEEYEIPETYGDWEY